MDNRFWDYGNTRFNSNSTDIRNLHRKKISNTWTGTFLNIKT